ncbi:hypothetical protein B0H12DRAFT_1258577 [Mycena haematopus]|nr:hypothetical protein B0H12DRAFT_1258577 [Mycena haematopus]
MGFSVLWALGAVFIWLLLSFVPIGSPVERLFWAVTTVFVWCRAKYVSNRRLASIDFMGLEVKCCGVHLGTGGHKIDLRKGPERPCSLGGKTLRSQNPSPATVSRPPPHDLLSHAFDDIACAVGPALVWWIFLAKRFQVNAANNPSLYPDCLDDISNDSDPNYYPSSPDDVFQVRRFLVEFLPIELVNIILDEAKYWPRIRSTRDRTEIIIAYYRNNNNASFCCLVTPPFPVPEALGGPSARLHVKLVEFDVLSNDQGWCDHPQDKGTYNGSYTWLEAAILRPGTVKRLLAVYGCNLLLQKSGTQKL